MSSAIAPGVLSHHLATSLAISTPNRTLRKLAMTFTGLAFRAICAAEFATPTNATAIDSLVSKRCIERYAIERAAKVSTFDADDEHDQKLLKYLWEMFSIGSRLGEHSNVVHQCRNQKASSFIWFEFINQQCLILREFPSIDTINQTAEVWQTVVREFRQMAGLYQSIDSLKEVLHKERHTTFCRQVGRARKSCSENEISCVAEADLRIR